MRQTRQRKAPALADDSQPSPEQMAVALELLKLTGYTNVVSDAMEKARKILDRIREMENR